MGVEFDEGGETTTNFAAKTPGNNFMVGREAAPRQSALARLIIKMHLAKTDRGVNIAMIIITICAFLITLGVLGMQFGIFNKIIPSRNSQIRYKEDIPESMKESLPPGVYDNLPSRKK